MFKDPEPLAQLYPAFVLHGIMTFRTPRVMRFLGHQVPVQSGKVNGRFKGPARSDRLERPAGVCLRQGIGINGIQIYDQMAQLLRVETTLNAPEVFKVYRTAPAQSPLQRLPRPAGKPAPLKLPSKSLTRCVAPQPTQAPRRWQRLRRTGTDRPRRAQVSRAANVRSLEALARTHATEPLRAAVAKLCQPVQRDGYRFRGLNPLRQPDATLLETVRRGPGTLNGFRNADLRKYLYSGPARSARQARQSSAAVSRKLRRLRVHGLIRKVPRSHRYRLTSQGRKLTTLLIAARKADVERLAAFAA